MFENLAQIRHASRQELVAYLEYWGIACYDDEPTSLLREAAVDTFWCQEPMIAIDTFKTEIKK